MVAALAIMLVLGVVLALNARWIALDERVPGDPAHICLSLRAARGPDPVPEVLARFSQPSLPGLVCAALFEVFGADLATAAWSVFPFGVVYLVSLYGLGRRLGGEVGGLGALLVGAADAVFLSQLHRLDTMLPASAMLAASLYYFLASEQFRKFGPSIAAGLFAGLALLCRVEAILPLVLPLGLAMVGAAAGGWRALVCTLAVVVSLLATGGEAVAGLATAATVYGQDGAAFLADHWPGLLLGPAALLAIRRLAGAGAARAANLAAALAVVETVALPTYYLQMVSFSEQFQRFRGGFEPSYGLPTLVGDCFPGLPVLVLVGLAMTVRLERRARVEAAWIAAMAVSSLAGLVLLLPFNEPRWAIQFLPYTAVLGGYWVGCLGRFRALGAGALASVGLLYTAWSFSFSTLPPEESGRVALGESAFSLRYPDLPAPDSRGLRGLAGALAEEMRQRGRALPVHFYWMGRYALAALPDDERMVQTTRILLAYDLYGPTRGRPAWTSDLDPEGARDYPHFDVGGLVETVDGLPRSPFLVVVSRGQGDRLESFERRFPVLTGRSLEKLRSLPAGPGLEYVVYLCW